MRPGKVLAVQKNVKVCGSNLLAHLHAKQAGKRLLIGPYSTLPIFFTAAIRRALSSVTNFENSGASK